MAQGMDLRVYGRTLLRFWYILLLGTALAVALGLVSYYKVRFDGFRPHLTPRSQPVYQSQATLSLLPAGFSLKRFTDTSGYAALTPLYARMVQSDAVRRLIVKRGGPLQGAYTAIPGSQGRSLPQPVINIIGSGPSPSIARGMAVRAMNGFLEYFASQRATTTAPSAPTIAGAPPPPAIKVSILNQPGAAAQVKGRKKTLPIVVFIAVLLATVVLVFVLENMWPRVRPVAAELPLSDARRSA